MNNIENRIKQIKANLILEQPYFGSISALQKSKLNEDIQTFSSTPDYFEYNDDYLECLDDDEVSFLLTNSAMHQAFGYSYRKEGRMDWLWTMAQDYTINSLLVNNGLKLPDALLYDERFDTLSTEAVYKILEDEIDDEKHTPKDVENIRYEKMQDTNEYDQDPIEDMHEQLINKTNIQGDLPLGIEILIPSIQNNTITWEDELYTIIENSVKFDYTLTPPNKRYLSQGVALPSLSGTKTKLIIAIDSSGSINNSLLARFLNDVSSIMNTFVSFEIELLVADASVHQHYTLYPGDELEYKLKGGGGTNFEETFNYIDKNISNPTLCLYFTDTLGKFPKDEPYFDTIWVSTLKDAKVPFGRLVFLD